MTRTKTLFLLLSLLMLACTLTAQVPRPQEKAVMTAQAVMPAERTKAPTISISPQVCQVETGVDAGRLNLRACGGLACPVLAVIREGDSLTITRTIKGWFAVDMAGGLRGWVNSEYCEVTK